MSRLLALIVPLLIFAAPARAELVELVVTKIEPYADGRPIGDVGPCERLQARARFALDPRLPTDRIIVDLDLCPVNASGKVEFQADVELLVPVDRTKLNGALFYEVNNRGNKTAPNIFNGGGADDFLLRQGFVVAWSGWIAEVHPGDGRLLLMPPIPEEDGRPLRGVVRQELVVDRAAPRASVMHRGSLGAYRPNPATLSQAILTRREREADPQETVPRDAWKLVVTEVEHEGRPWPLPKVELEVDGGLQPGLIYEIVYEAEGSVVQGAGLAGIRDLISFLKYDASEKNPLLAADRRPIVNRALGFGTSQSGRCLRQFLYDGFNADAQGRPVFDGVLSHVAGGGLGFFNHRFASPTRTNGQHEEHSFPADMFPFTYGDSVDPFASTPAPDGILRKARAAGVVPKVMHTQSSSEYWHRSGSLVHTDPQATRDAEIPAEVRIYTFGGTRHGAGDGVGPAVTLADPARSSDLGQLPTNPADYRPLMRALLAALDAWVRAGTPPPPSVYPRSADGTLVGAGAKEVGWPALPGVRFPTVVQQPGAYDRGPEWTSRRRIALEPPREVGRYEVRVPAVDPDGNERGCLNLPTLAVPIATYTSWNLRSPAIGAATELLGLQGGYVPFCRTVAEREATDDPRLAVQQRYRDFNDYRRKLTAAARALVAARYLLVEDVARIEALAEKHRGLFD